MRTIVGARNDETIGKFAAERIEYCEDWGDFLGVGVCSDNKLIAAVIFNSFSVHDVHVTVAAGSKYWATRETLRQLFSLPFVHWGQARVTAVTSKKNKRARRLIEGVGFKQEGRLRDYYGRGKDAIIYGMLKTECKWVR